MKLGYYRVRDDVKEPIRATTGSICFDVFIHNRFKEVLRIRPHQTILVGTGLIFDIPTGYHIRLYERSSTCIKASFKLANSVGIIDSDYREELRIPLTNYTNSDIVVPYDEYTNRAFFQVGVFKNTKFELVEVKERPKRLLSRSGGFGSTS